MVTLGASRVYDGKIRCCRRRSDSRRRQLGEPSARPAYPPAARHLQRGDNPLYVKVVQEDGHVAWSSPVYLVHP